MDSANDTKISDALINSYLDARMKPLDAQKFEHTLSSNEAIQNRFKLLQEKRKNLVEAIPYKSVELNQFEEIKSELVLINQNILVPKKTKWWQRVWNFLNTPVI